MLAVQLPCSTHPVARHPPPLLLPWGCHLLPAVTQQATQSSLNTAGLALVMQTIATGLLVTASVANQEYSEALGDGIQVRVGGCLSGCSRVHSAVSLPDMHCLRACVTAGGQ